MTQEFSRRLDFIMGVTRTTNSALARALSFDASYICRIRNGRRGMPRNQPFAEPAASYLVSRVSDTRAQHALEEAIGHIWPDSEQEAAELVAYWLLEGSSLANAASSLAVGHVIAALGAPTEDGSKLAPNTGGGVSAPEPASSQLNVSFYFGNEGKREAVLTFLGRLAAEGKPYELLLHSDEDMTWLYEDNAFARRWSALLLRVISNGCRIRIVHALSRDANEMWEAVGKWMPLYMTGAIEPYYYPRLRDGVYRRTLFVARGHSAIAAASVGSSDSEGLNLLVYERDAVAAYEREFEGYLALCRPLMRIAFPEDDSELSTAIGAFAKGEGGLLAALVDGKLVCAREQGGALVANMASPLITFGIDEQRMAAAVWGYLQTLPADSLRRDAAAKELLASFG